MTKADATILSARLGSARLGSARLGSARQEHSALFSVCQVIFCKIRKKPETGIFAPWLRFFAPLGGPTAPGDAKPSAQKGKSRKKGEISVNSRNTHIPATAFAFWGKAVMSHGDAKAPT